VTRRRATALLALALAAPPALAAHSDERTASRETEFDGLRLLAETSRGVHFGYVEADTRPSEGAYLCGAMRRDEAAAAASTVAGALSYLPDAVVARLRLRYVVLCGGASESGRSIGGIPVAPLNLLMLDGTGDGASLQHRTLHELYHLLEYRSGGIGDAEWASQFGGSYSNAYQGLLHKAPIGSGKPGFVTSYGESHPHEDRAELFAWLVLAPGEVAALIRRTGDAVLKRKADFLSDKCQRAVGLAIALPN
jgi:hypothetical protein